MPNEPQDRSPDIRVQQFGEGPDRTTPEEVAEPGLEAYRRGHRVAIYGHR